MARSSRASRISRGGPQFFGPNVQATLPPAGGGSPSFGPGYLASILDVGSDSDWGMGRSPISAIIREPRSFRGHVQATTPYRAPFTSVRRRFFPTFRVAAPLRARFCVQRKQRREVLFAIGRAGRGGRSWPRRYRRTQNSYYSC